MVARFHQLAQRADRSHSTGKDRRSDTAFERAEVLLQASARGITGSRVIVALGFA